VKSNSLVQCRITFSSPQAVDLFSAAPQLGRFTLRDEGKTIAIGKITHLLDNTGHNLNATAAAASVSGAMTTTNGVAEGS
jgi:peptide chain release factor subunit 3